MSGHRIFGTAFSAVYPMYVQKAERKERTRDEVDEILRWHTGYSQQQLIDMLDDDTDLAGFYEGAPRLNPHRSEIRGVICGVRIEEIEEPLMREIRYTDKMIDELAKGRPMTKILRG